MNLTTSIATSATTIALTNAMVDKEGNIDIRKRNEYLGTTISTTATVAVGYTLNNATLDRVHNKYCSAYVESMSDSELEAALQEMNLLACEETTNKDVKTL